ncbi:hypothetical protein B0H63DRAFT_548734 [Podospora didyma]|uniref:Uncharacterized protein n=1 Tax=Podospora didyma TaxID=330526 RepID=A0AAE0KM38_9PEZI|nr:hypothetical protein B0H63DRAFT_548734 [Podospora didyma]
MVVTSNQQPGVAMGFSLLSLSLLVILSSLRGSPFGSPPGFEMFGKMLSMVPAAVNKVTLPFLLPEFPAPTVCGLAAGVLVLSLLPPLLTALSPSHSGKDSISGNAGHVSRVSSNVGHPLQEGAKLRADDSRPIGSFGVLSPVFNNVRKRRDSGHAPLRLLNRLAEKKDVAWQEPLLMPSVYGKRAPRNARFGVHNQEVQSLQEVQTLRLGRSPVATRVQEEVRQPPALRSALERRMEPRGFFEPPIPRSTGLRNAQSKFDPMPLWRQKTSWGEPDRQREPLPVLPLHQEIASRQQVTPAPARFLEVPQLPPSQIQQPVPVLAAHHQPEAFLPPAMPLAPPVVQAICAGDQDMPDAPSLEGEEAPRPKEATSSKDADIVTEDIKVADVDMSNPVPTALPSSPLPSALPVPQVSLGASPAVVGIGDQPVPKPALATAPLPGVPPAPKIPTPAPPKVRRPKCTLSPDGTWTVFWDEVLAPKIPPSQVLEQKKQQQQLSPASSSISVPVQRTPTLAPTPSVVDSGNLAPAGRKIAKPRSTRVPRQQSQPTPSTSSSVTLSTSPAQGPKSALPPSSTPVAEAKEVPQGSSAAVPKRARPVKAAKSRIAKIEDSEDFLLGGTFIARHVPECIDEILSWMATFLAERAPAGLDLDVPDWTARAQAALNADDQFYRNPPDEVLEPEKVTPWIRWWLLTILRLDINRDHDPITRQSVLTPLLMVLPSFVRRNAPSTPAQPVEEEEEVSEDE